MVTGVEIEVIEEVRGGVVVVSVEVVGGILVVGDCVPVDFC